MATVYFHRKLGLAYVVATNQLPRLKERLREALGERYVEADWDVTTAHGGPVRIKALGKGHLDLTSTSDPNQLSG
jgi:hypothetical protein